MGEPPAVVSDKGLEEPTLEPTAEPRRTYMKHKPGLPFAISKNVARFKRQKTRAVLKNNVDQPPDTSREPAKMYVRTETGYVRHRPFLPRFGLLKASADMFYFRGQRDQSLKAAEEAART